MAQNEDLFEAFWDLRKFQTLVERGLSFGSMYFFLIKVTGLFFLVRDTDSEGIDPILRNSQKKSSGLMRNG